jgi:site-specific recombinase XerD
MAPPSAILSPAAGSLDPAIDEYLTFLRVERGVAPATIRAYRSDLTDFSNARDSGRDWALGPEAAVRYLAARTRRGRPNDPGLAPTSLRRRAASIRGFYRFAFGEGLIRVDVAAQLDLPRQPRILPETLTVDEAERLLEGAGLQVTFTEREDENKEPGTVLAMSPAPGTQAEKDATVTLTIA